MKIARRKDEERRERQVYKTTRISKIIVYKITSKQVIAKRKQKN